MNSVVLMGRLTRDPEVRVSQSGDNSLAIGRYTLAVDRKKKKGSEENSADFINIVCFGSNAEFAEKYLKKGTKFARIHMIMQGQLEELISL